MEALASIFFIKIELAIVCFISCFINKFLKNCSDGFVKWHSYKKNLIRKHIKKNGSKENEKSEQKTRNPQKWSHLLTPFGVHQYMYGEVSNILIKFLFYIWRKQTKTKSIKKIKTGPIIWLYLPDNDILDILTYWKNWHIDINTWEMYLIFS